MAKRQNEQDSPSERRKPASGDDEMIRSGGEDVNDIADDDDDELDDTEDLDEEEEEGEGSF